MRIGTAITCALTVIFPLFAGLAYAQTSSPPVCSTLAQSKHVPVAGRTSTPP